MKFSIIACFVFIYKSIRHLAQEENSCNTVFIVDWGSLNMSLLVSLSDGCIRISLSMFGWLMNESNKDIEECCAPMLSFLFGIHLFSQTS